MLLPSLLLLAGTLGSATESAPEIGLRSTGFVENIGQFRPEARYWTREGDMDLFLTDDGFVARVGGEDGAAAVVTHTFVGATRPTFEPTRPTGAHHQWLIGADASEWVRDARSFGAVRMRGVYPGVDLALHLDRGFVEYDVVAAPGVRIDTVRLRIAGAEEAFVDAEGSLVATTAVGAVRHFIPIAWEEDGDGARRPITARFRSFEDGTFGFETGARDSSRRLVIDPGITYGSYLGGGLDDTANEVRVDTHGDLVVIATTSSTDFPWTPGPSSTQQEDVAVMKFSSSTGALLWATRIGGSVDDTANALDLDPSDAIYVLGDAFSSDFPVTAGAFDVSHDGAHEGFLLKLDPTGASLVYSTFIGATSPVADKTSDLVIDDGGAAYATGDTKSASFPVTAGAYDVQVDGKSSAWLLKLNSSGSALIFSTLFEGSDLKYTGGRGVALLGSEPIIAGATTSLSLPTTGGAVQPTAPGVLNDGFAARFSSDGSTLLACTYLGADVLEVMDYVETDDNQLIHLVGSSWSANYPVTPGVFGPTYAGGLADIVYSVLSADMTALVASTFLGGADIDIAWDLVVDRQGRATVVGQTGSVDLPTTSGAAHATAPGAGSGFVFRLFPGASAITYGTYIGGSGQDACTGVALDAAGDAWVVGWTFSGDLPTTAGSHDSTYGGAFDGLLVQLELPWVDLGSALAGAAGAPYLMGDGSLAANSPVALTIDGAAPSAAAALFIGLTEVNLPSLGGTLVPSPDLTLFGLVTSSDGDLSLAGTWPAAAAVPGLTLAMQMLVADPTAPAGVAMSNGVRVTVP